MIDYVIDYAAAFFVLLWVFPIWLSIMIAALAWGKPAMLNIPFLLGPAQAVGFLFLYVYAYSPK
jgi:hypothetical protein